MEDNSLEEVQREICSKYGFPYEESLMEMKVGISLNTKDNIEPIHALRHPPEADTSGWYIWCGDYSSDTDFFKPLHVHHLKDWCPLILPFLGLPKGCRVLIAENGNYVDIWEDFALLKT
ncbi:MAG: hypothetical protein EOO89_23245 [Pedobacter sp.]|nr:MAG: hypothetical protein EOO89_23245 [Pedobacter sp.]